MVVMLLISIVLAVVIPRFDGGPLQDPNKKLSRWMINTVRQLRASSIQKQRVQILVVDLSGQRMWITHEKMSDEEQIAAADKGFRIDKSMQIVDVQYPDRAPINNDTAEIRFYPAGYSDRVLIHIENDDAERLTYVLEPLLPKLKIVEEWIEI
jgi:Tfp pilus assembly protein FimT